MWQARQRPDVRAAERKLAAETARVGENMTARYPSFTLSGSIGLESLVGALTGSFSAISSLLSGVGLTLFDSGRVTNEIESQNAVQQQAYAS